MAAPTTSGIIRSITARCITAAIGTEAHFIFAIMTGTFGSGSTAAGITTSGAVRARIGLAPIVTGRL